MTASILVVDDHIPIARLFAEFLTEKGYRVRCAFDGEAALRAIAQAPPDLLVSDIHMPRLDGLNLTKRLRARGVQIPIVLVSAEVPKVPLPNVTVLSKPVDLDDFARLIEQLLVDSAEAHGPEHDARGRC